MESPDGRVGPPGAGVLDPICFPLLACGLKPLLPFQLLHRTKQGTLSGPVGRDDGGALPGPRSLGRDGCSRASPSRLRLVMWTDV